MKVDSKVLLPSISLLIPGATVELCTSTCRTAREPRLSGLCGDMQGPQGVTKSQSPFSTPTLQREVA